MVEKNLSETALDRKIEDLSSKILAGSTSSELRSEYENLQVLRRSKLHLPSPGAPKGMLRRYMKYKIPA